MVICRLFRNFAPDLEVKGRSPVGLERFSHIEEVPGSSPGVPTKATRMCQNRHILIFCSFQPAPKLLLSCSYPAPRLTHEYANSMARARDLFCCLRSLHVLSRGVCKCYLEDSARANTRDSLMSLACPDAIRRTDGQTG